LTKTGRRGECRGVFCLDQNRAPRRMPRRFRSGGSHSLGHGL